MLFTTSSEFGSKFTEGVPDLEDPEGFEEGALIEVTLLISTANSSTAE
jgi:hypothetical protein